MLMGREDSRADLAPLHLALPIKVESMCSAYGCRVVVALALVVYLADATEKHLENITSAGFGIDDVAKICQHLEQAQAVVTHGMFLCVNSVSRCCKNTVAAGSSPSRTNSMLIGRSACLPKKDRASEMNPTILSSTPC